MRAAAVLLPLALLAGCVASEEAPAVPLVYAPGADAAAAGLVVAPDGSAFSATLLGVPGATLAVGEAVTLANVANGALVAHLSAPRVEDPLVPAFRIEWMGGDAIAGTLDLKADAPGVALRVPPGGKLVGRVTLTLAEGAGPVHVPIATAVQT